MTSRDDGLDPRKVWRLVYRIARITPPWLLSFLQRIARLGWRLTWRENRKTLPQHWGLYLWTGDINAALYEQRLIAALDLLAERAPVYLRWLRISFDVLCADQWLRIMRAPIRPDYPIRALSLNPYMVWKSSREQLALYLVLEATRGRAGRRFRRTRAGRRRASRRGLEEMVVCARHLPGSQALIEECEKLLRAYDERSAKAAA
jgi:hypothetical protein